MKDEQSIQFQHPYGARKFNNNSNPMAQWETHQTDNSSFVLKKRTLITIPKGSEPYATPLNFPPPPGGSKNISRALKTLPSTSARDKNEQSQRNYLLLRDPNLWIHRSMSDQINIMKELNSDLAECKFRDEEIRANQEKLNFKLDHRRLQVKISSETKIHLPTYHQQRAVTEINESLSKENTKESETSNNHELTRQKHNYIAALDSLTPPKKHITSINHTQPQQQPVNSVVPQALASSFIEQQSKLVSTSQPSSTEDTHPSSTDNHPNIERVTIIRARGNCNHSRVNHSNPNNTYDNYAYSKVKLKSNKLYLQRLYSQIGPALQANLTQQQLYNMNSPDIPYSKHAQSLAAIAICNHNKIYNNFQTQQNSQFQQSYQYPMQQQQFQQQVNQSNNISSSSASPQRLFIETFHITPKAKEISYRKQRQQQRNKQQSLQQSSSSSSWEKEDQQNLSKDSVLETQHPAVNGNTINDRNSFSEMIEEGAQVNTNRGQQYKSPKAQTQQTKKAEKQSYFVKKQQKKHPAEILALGGSYALLFSIQSVNKLPKDKQANCRFAAYRDFLQSINFSNRIYVNLPEDKPQTNHPLYRAYVGKGNNNMLIRMVIKQRWWWSITDNKDDQAINFVWTQQRKNDVLKSIKSLFKSQRIIIQGQTNNINSNSSQQAQNSPRTFTNNNNSTSSQLLQQQQSNLISCSSLNSIQSGQSGESTSDDSCVSLLQKQSSQQGQLQQQQNNNSLILQRNSVQLRKLCSQQDFNVLHSILASRREKDIDVQAIQWNNNSAKIQQSSQLPCDILRKTSDPQNTRLHNHLQDNFHLSNKKALFYNMREYYQQQRKDPFQFIPLTFHIQHGNTDKEYIKFLDKYKELQESKECNVWILKPGENTNRGSGIKVLNELTEIEQIISSPDVHKSTGIQMTYILQKYIHNPLLYYKRKFDIRTYYLLTTSNGYLKGYWYQDGYIRTASKEFTIKNLGKMIHLTNDAVQKKDDQYGKYEKGNKVSYEEMDKYIASLYPEKGFFTTILPQMKDISLDSMKAVYGKIDLEKKETTFEVFGLDFMIDENLKVFLIEVNTNPAIDICCPLLARIIPQMIENSFRIAVDPLFPPPAQLGSHKGFSIDGMLEMNKYELIFDEADESQQIQMIGKDMNLDWQMIKEEEQEENEEDIVPE